MNVDIRVKDETTKILNIQVEAEKVEAEFSRAIAGFQKRAHVPGFRKGKVPAEIVNKNYQHEIQDEVMQRLFSQTYPQALDQAALVPIQRPRIDKFQLERGKPLEYEITVEFIPELKLPAYKGIKLKAKKFARQEKEIQGVLDSLRQQHAVLKDTDEASALGHTVVLDFEGFANGVAVAGTKASGYAVELGSKQTIPDFETNLLGLKSGVEKTFDAVFPNDYHAAELAGKTVTFKVKVQAVKTKDLPALDDAFAQSLGPFETLAALTQKIEEDLEKDFERQKRASFLEQIMSDLGQNTKVALPASLLNGSLEHVVEQQAQALAKENKNWSDSKLSEEDFRNAQRPVVESELRAQLAVRKIADLEKIVLAENEVEQDLQRLSQSLRRPVSEIRRLLEKNDRLDELRSRLTNEKVMDLIISHAKISET
jgi:trigger factor